MQTTKLIVKTPVFEGPLDLLLSLIESRKLFINDISLASVTDEYLARIEAMDELPIGEASEFIALAATLLLIKSRSLLPTLALSEEESRDIKELEYRLALYQIIRNAARGLSTALKEGMLWEGVSPVPASMFLPDQSATPASLHATALRLLHEFPGQAPVMPRAVVKKVISLEEMIEKMAARVSSAMRLSFKEFASHGKRPSDYETHKREIVVSFLALLELVKRGAIRASQEGTYGDIMLEHDSVSVPSYE